MARRILAVGAILAAIGGPAYAADPLVYSPPEQGSPFYGPTSMVAAHVDFALGALFGDGFGGSIEVGESQLVEVIHPWPAPSHFAYRDRQLAVRKQARIADDKSGVEIAGAQHRGRWEIRQSAAPVKPRERSGHSDVKRGWLRALGGPGQFGGKSDLRRGRRRIELPVAMGGVHAVNAHVQGERSALTNDDTEWGFRVRGDARQIF